MRELREFWKMYLRTPLSERAGEGLMMAGASGTPRGEGAGRMGFGSLNGAVGEGDIANGTTNGNGAGTGGRPTPRRSCWCALVALPLGAVEVEVEEEAVN